GAARSGRRIGLVQGTDWEDCADCQADLLAAAARKLERAGTAVVPLRWPPELSAAWELAQRILAAEARQVHLEHVNAQPGRVSAALTELVQQGERISRPDYLSCL